VIALASNPRRPFSGLEIPRWSSEVVRLAFAIDTHDSEVMACVATTGGVSGEMKRDLMLACVERQFTALRAPPPCAVARRQWLGLCRPRHTQLCRRNEPRRRLYAIPQS
jgi:hypothetical protein